MSKARRERQARRAKDMADQGQSITLVNPVANHYKAWIVGNAATRDRMAQRQVAEFLSVEPSTVGREAFETAIRDGFVPDDYMVRADSATGQHLVLCGAGPTLAENAAEWCPQGDQVWGCNSALTYLHENGHKVTHGFAIDQTADMLHEWHSAPDVEYLLASTVHPNLPEYLLGKGRKLRFFHNYVGVRERPVAYALCKACGETLAHGSAACDCGGETDDRIMEYEDWMYSALYPPCVRSGSGLNSVSRALDVARYMGFERISVLGADCALRVRRPQPDCVMGSPEHIAWLKEDVVMHADGGHALVSGATHMTMTGEIDGRTWTTKPDMVITAVWLRKMARVYPQIRLIGDTLPNAIMDKPESYIRRLPSLTNMHGEDIPVCEAV